MLEEIKRQVETSLSPLIAGILNDGQKLMRQEIALAKAEFREDFTRLKAAISCLFLGAVFASAAIFLLLFSAIYGLVAAFPELPLWGSFGIVTLLVTALAGAFLSLAKSRLARVKMIPEQTVETIKENAQWIQRKA